MASDDDVDKVGAAAQRGDLERQIADIWQQLLGVPVVRVNDNFFRLGGYSVLAFDLFSKVRRAYGCAVPIREFFRQPTVEAMAALVHNAAGRSVAEPEPTQPTVVPGPRFGTFQASFNQEAQILVCQELPSPAFPMTLFLHAEGNLDYPLLRRALDEVARRHDSLRMSFPGLPGGLATRVAPAGGFEWPCQYADVTGLDAAGRDREIERLAGGIAEEIDLINGPVVAALVIRTGPCEWLIGVSLDHLVCDGISLQIVLADIAGWYNALLAGNEPGLALLPYQYQDYASAQRQLLSGPAGRELADYWIAKYKRHGSVVPILDLVPHATRDPEAVGRLTFARRTLGTEFSPMLTDYCQHRGVTPYVVFLTALLRSVRRFTRGDATGVVMLESGRNWDGVAGLVGWFANALPLWADIAADADFGETLSQVSADVWDNITNSTPATARPWQPGADHVRQSAREMAAAYWVPHILFTCDVVPFSFPVLRDATLRHYPVRSGEAIENAPVVHVDIGTTGGAWIVEMSYVAEAHKKEVIADILDGMIAVMREQFERAP